MPGRIRLKRNVGAGLAAGWSKLSAVSGGSAHEAWALPIERVALGNILGVRDDADVAVSVRPGVTVASHHVAGPGLVPTLIPMARAFPHVEPLSERQLEGYAPFLGVLFVLAILTTGAFRVSLKRRRSPGAALGVGLGSNTLPASSYKGARCASKRSHAMPSATTTTHMTMTLTHSGSAAAP